MRVRFTPHVEQILRSVIADCHLTDVSLLDIWEDRSGWQIKVASKDTFERSFHVLRGTAPWVRDQIARHLGVPA